MQPWVALGVTYRDGANYKYNAAILLEGEWDQTHATALRDALQEGTNFIPDQIGIPHQGEMQTIDFPTPDDHCWHEFIGDGAFDARTFNSYDEALAGHGWGASYNLGTVADFLEKVMAAAREGWEDSDPLESHS